MKVYKPTKFNSMHTLFVSPGEEHPENSEWIDDETKKSKMFTILFKYGVAEVDSQLGKFLIDKKLAASSPLISVNGEPI